MNDAMLVGLRGMQRVDGNVLGDQWQWDNVFAINVGHIGEMGVGGRVIEPNEHRRWQTIVDLPPPGYWT